MRVFVILLIVILVFFGCAKLGYEFANQVDAAEAQLKASGPGDVLKGEQHDLVFVRVDRLDNAEPRLVSVWFVSLYFLEGNSTTLTLAQIYPPKTGTPASNSIERTFGLTAQGEPLPGFWNAVSAYDLRWDNYILTDLEGANYFLNWLVGPGDFRGSLEAVPGNPDEGLRIVNQTCQAIASTSDHEIGQFNWGQLFPAHFHSSLRLETGLALWDRMFSSGLPVRCDIIPAP